MSRKTADTIALIFAGITAVVVISLMVAILYVKITAPDQQMDEGVKAMGQIVTTLIAALVGYTAGRRTNGQ